MSEKLMSKKENIELKYPFEINGVTCNTLSIRRPKVNDRLIAEKSSGTEIEKEIRLIANLCEVSPDNIMQLDLADYVAVQECLTGFLS